MPETTAATAKPVCDDARLVDVIEASLAGLGAIPIESLNRRTIAEMIAADVWTWLAEGDPS